MVQNSFDLIPHVVINPSGIVSYNEIIWHKPRIRQRAIYIDTSKPIADQLKFINSKRKSEGNVSEQAKRKISKAIEYLLTTSPKKKVYEKLTGKYVVFKTCFLTLTLPSKQIHSDKEIINTCLNSFLIELKKYHNLKNYIWRAELQKNGNIHFHIVTNVFIPWWEARNRWNRIVNKLGYVDRFQQKNGNKTPNSTDIHSTRKVKNLKSYLIKYMAKDENNYPGRNENEENIRTQEGRIWACDQQLGKAKGLNLIVDNEIYEELKKIVNSGRTRKYEGNYFTCYFIDYHILKELGANILFQYFSNYLIETLNFNEQLTI